MAYFSVLCCAAALMLSACAQTTQELQAERQAMAQTVHHATSDTPNPPNTPGLYLALIERMRMQGADYAALAHLDAYEKKYGVCADSTLQRADALRATGQLDASAIAYQALLKTPYAARGYRGLGLLAGLDGKFEQATGYLEKAAALAPTDAVALSDLAYAHLMNGEIAAARVPLFEAAELEQQNPKILSNLALYFVVRGQEAAAQRLMDQQRLSSQTREALYVIAAQVTTRARERQAARPTASATKAVAVLTLSK